MRKYRVKFDVTECMKHYSMCGGQRAVECGDDPSGGFSTRSAHQMPARDDLWIGKVAMMATLIPRQKLRLLFGATTGKVRVRGTHDVSAAPPPDHHFQRYGRVARCAHGQQLHLHRGERYRVGKTRPEKESARPHDVSAAPLTGSSPSFQQCRGAWDCWDRRESLGPRPAQHLSGPRGAQHDACADPRDARQKKSAHDIAHLTTVCLTNHRGGSCGVHG